MKKIFGLAFFLDFLQSVKVCNFGLYLLHRRATGRMALISLPDVIPGVQAGNSKEECVHRFSNRQDENDRKQCMNLSSKVTNNTLHLEDVAVS